LWPGILLLPKAKNIPVGKRVGEWVSELFITTLDAEGFLVEDVLDLSHGRGAFEAVLADEDVEEDPDRWCSSTECGQELWQIACQWVWNEAPLPGTDDAGRPGARHPRGPLPKKLLLSSELQNPHRKRMARGPWAAAFGRATGRFGAEDARVARGQEAALPSRGQPELRAKCVKRMPLRKLAVAPFLPDGLSTLFFARAVSGKRRPKGIEPVV